MKKKVFILIVILLIGFLLRRHDLTVSPRLGSTFDEYAWTWLGMNLIQSHVPISWSPQPQYKIRHEVVYQGAHFAIVKPYLEHPPLFGLVAGGFALAHGARDMYHLTLGNIRPLALLLGVFSILMVFLLGRTLYSTNFGLLASFIYAVTPTVVIGSRIVQNENFFIPFFLASLVLIFKFISSRRPLYRNSAAIICGLLTLAKVPWFAASLAACLILLYNRNYKDIFKFLAIVIPIFSLFIIYGFYFDRQLFVGLWQLQLNRYDIAFDSVYVLFTTPYLVDRFMIDGWIYFGWIAFFILLTKRFKDHYMIILPLLAYFAIFVYAIPNEPGHGWYRYPFYPFLVMSLALFIKEYFNKNYLLTFFFLLFIGLSMLQLSWAFAFGFSFIVMRLFLLLSGGSLLPVFFRGTRVRKFSTILSYSMLFLLFVLNIWVILSFSDA